MSDRALAAATARARKQHGKVGTLPGDLIRLGKATGPRTDAKAGGPGASSSKEGTKKMKSTDEVMIGKNHVNPALILHLAQAEEDDLLPSSKLNSIICQALRQLKADRSGSEKAWFMSLVTLAKLKPELFTSDKVTDVLFSYLTKDPNQLHKVRNTALMPVLSWSLLMTAYKTHDNWPETFVFAYVDDAISERCWADHHLCKHYCSQITVVFGTIEPSASGLSTAGKLDTEVTVMSEDSNSGQEDAATSLDSDSKMSRFKNSAVQASIRDYVSKSISDYLKLKKTADMVSRNFLKFLCTANGLQDVRVQSAGRLDQWLNNTKLGRPAQELMAYLCSNTNTGSAEDCEVIHNLATLKIRSKPMATFFGVCLKDLITQHKDNINVLMKSTIFNELGLQGSMRNQTNMQMIAIFFKQDSDKAAVVLASVFQELLLRMEDYLRSLRTLLREIVRALHYELNFPKFALALMEEITTPAFKNSDPAVRERMFFSLNSLICLTILLSCKPSIKDIALSSSTTKTDVLPLIKFQNEVAVMQRDAVWWLYHVVPQQYRVTATHYYSTLKQVLFLEDPNVYAAKDNWPAENDRAVLVSLCAEVPLLDHTLMRLGVLGITPNLPLRSQDVLDIINRVVRRAAMLDSEGDIISPLAITDSSQQNNIIQVMMKLSAYRCPVNIKLPEGYTPPNLVIATHYWRSWQILLILAAFNPTTVGAMAWNEHKTLRGFMEMVITNNYQFPPQSINYQEAMLQERQLSAAEEADILVFEGHLAAATRGVKINKSNSQLLNQLLIVKEGGPMRKPPQAVLEQVRVLAMELHLGHKLCKVREPDFLLDIIKQQGTSRAMPWLTELVRSSEGSFELLPIQCLCEFMLQEIANTKQNILLARLQSVLFGTEDSGQTLEIVHYFTSRMSGTNHVRTRALRGLKTILNKGSSYEDDSEWLLGDIVNIPQHNQVSSTICRELRKALQVEVSVPLLTSYLIYICRYCPPNARVAMAKDIATCIVNRHDTMLKVLASSAKVLLSLVDIFSQLFSSYKGTEKGVLLEVEGVERSFDFVLVQAVLLLLSSARGRDCGISHSVTKLLSLLFPSDKDILSDHSAALVTHNIAVSLIGSGVPQLQNLSMSTLSTFDKVQMLKSLSLPETAAQYIMEKLEAELDDVSTLQEQCDDEDDLIHYVQAWRLSCTSGEKLEALLLSSSTPPAALQEVDFFLEQSSDTVCEEMDVEEGEIKSWLDHLESVFTKNCLHSQALIFKSCLKQCETEDIGSGLLEWLSENTPPSLHHQFVVALVQILSSSCSSSLVKKLLSVTSHLSPSLSSLNNKMFPTQAANPHKDAFSLMTAWSKQPEDIPFTSLLSSLKSCAPITADPAKWGNVWKKVLHTAVCNHGNHGITLEPILEVIVSKMGSEPCCVGMFMDWLNVLSPELDCFKMLLGSSVSVPIQRYLLNMLCSCSGWTTLHSCVCYLLQEEGSAVEDSLALDFIQGCCDNERIWQGANSKRGTTKGSLSLTSAQIWRLTELIMGEVQSVEGDKQFVLLSWRLPLLLSKDSEPLLPALMCKLQHYSHKSSKVVAVSLYLARPNLLPQGPSPALIRGAITCFDTPAACDPLVQQLVVNVYNKSAPSKDKETNNSASGYILLRRLAACHPPLILRHLEIIDAAVGLRANLPKKEFSQGNHASVFKDVLGLLEALAPHAFRAEHSTTMDSLLTKCLEYVTTQTKSELRDIPSSHVSTTRSLTDLTDPTSHSPDLRATRSLPSLTSFTATKLTPPLFTLFEPPAVRYNPHLFRRAHTAAILKLVDLLSDLIEMDRPRALVLVEGFRDKLRKLEGRMKEPQVAKFMECCVSGASPRVQCFEEQHMAPYLSQLCGDGVECYAILQDLDKGSLRKPGVLKLFISEICRRMTDDVAECRALAHTLAVRHVRYEPKESSLVVNAVQEALLHPQECIVKSALQALPELALLGGPEITQLMRTAFSAAVKSDALPDLVSVVNTVLQSSDLR